MMTLESSNGSTLEPKDGIEDILEQRMAAIKIADSKINDLLNELESFQTKLIQKQESDFVNAYKDHMMKVQFELIQFKKKSSEFYLNVKKSEKIVNLESTVVFLRTESINLSQKVEELRESNKKCKMDLKTSQEECEFWKQNAQVQKHQIILLKKTVQDLKSPALMHKYEENGRRKAEAQHQIKESQKSIEQVDPKESELAFIRTKELNQTHLNAFQQRDSIKSLLDQTLIQYNQEVKPNSALPGARGKYAAHTSRHSFSKKIYRNQTTRTNPFTAVLTDVDTKLTQFGKTAISDSVISHLPGAIRELMNRIEQLTNQLLGDQVPQKQMIELIIKEFASQMQNLKVVSSDCAASQQPKKVRSISPQRQGLYAPLSGQILPQNLLQEVFYDCCQSLFRLNQKLNNLEHLSSSPKSSLQNFRASADDETKIKAITKFICKPSIMQSLYNVMFLDRKPNRGQYESNQLAETTLSQRHESVEHLLQKNQQNIGFKFSTENRNIYSSGEVMFKNKASSNTLPHQVKHGSVEVLDGGSLKIQNAVNTFALRNRQVGSEHNIPNILSYATSAPMDKVQKQAQKSKETFKNFQIPKVNITRPGSQVRVQNGKLLLKKSLN